MDTDKADLCEALKAGTLLVQPQTRPFFGLRSCMLVPVDGSEESKRRVACKQRHLANKGTNPGLLALSLSRKGQRVE